MPAVAGGAMRCTEMAVDAGCSLPKSQWHFVAAGSGGGTGGLGGKAMCAGSGAAWLWCWRRRPPSQPSPRGGRGKTRGQRSGKRAGFAGCWLLGVQVFGFSPSPVWMRRGAQRPADKGLRLSEPKASLSKTPLGASTAGCPQRSEGTQPVGSPFFGVLFFGETKKSASPAGATPGLRPAQRARLPQSAQPAQTARPPQRERPPQSTPRPAKKQHPNRIPPHRTLSCGTVLLL